MYQVIITDFKTKQSNCIATFSDKYNSLFFLEDYVLKYIESKHGIITELKVYSEHSKKSYGWINHPYGYIACRNINKSVNQIIVYYKYNKLFTFDVQPVFSIDIAEFSDEYFTDYYYFGFLIDKDVKDYYSNNVLPDLLQQFNNNIINV